MNHRHPIILLFLLFALGFVGQTGAQPFAATASVSTEEAFVGQPIQLYIQVQGTDAPAQPDVSGFSDFTVKYQGTQPQTQQQISIINGRRTQSVQRSAVLIYELTPKRAGTLTIPALVLEHEGKQVRTAALRVTAKQPHETDEVRLRIRLSQDECYVGEAIHATWTLYFGANLQNLRMTLPLLLDPAFTVPDFSPEIDPAKRQQYRRIVLDGQEIIALQDQGRLDGKDYTTLSFDKVLIPRVAGERLLPASTVVVDVVVGQRRTNDFFNPVRVSTRPVAVPSNSPKLTVKELPTEGRPANFAGHVGRYRLTATAIPTSVSVGDPIELTISLSGPEFLDPVASPALEQQADLTRDFRVSPAEPGEVQDGHKVFTRTLRAVHPDIAAIPAIELPYFDSAKGSYEVARSAPIPLEVRATKVVTAQDAEGTSPTLAADRKPKTRALGLAANYEDASVLRNQQAGLQAWLASPVWLGTLAGLPVAYLFLAVALGAYRRRHSDPAALRARRAGPVCLRALSGIHTAADAHERALTAIRNYFGAKFGLAAGALTYGDLAPRLEQAKLPSALCDELRQLFDHCEAGRYSGASTISPGELIPRAIDTIRRIDKSLGR